MNRTLSLILAFSAIFLLTPDLHTQTIFRAEPTKTIVEAGQIFSIKYILENEEGDGFELPDMQPFKILAGPSRSSSISIINGKRTSQISWTYQLLAPAEPGEYEITPAIIQSRRQRLTSTEINVKVIPKGAANTSPTTKEKKDKSFFLDVEVSTKNCYPGQLVLLNCKLYSKVNIASFEIIHSPQIEKAAVHPLRRFNASVQREIIGNEVYYSKLFQQWALFPQTPGILHIEPFVLQIAIEDEQQGGGLFNFFKNYTYETIIGNAVEINVRSLPSPTPEGNSGAVGVFEADLRLSTEKLKAGHSFTATLTVTGTGDLKRIGAPEIKWPEPFEQYDVKITEENYQETGSAIYGTKRFEYVIVPNETGTFDIPVSLIYFDTHAEDYIEINMDLNSIQVHSGDQHSKIKEDDVVDQNNDSSESFTGTEDRTALWGTTILWVLGSVLLLGSIVFLLFSRISKAKGIKQPLRFKEQSLDLLAVRFSEQDPERFYLDLQKIFYRWTAKKTGQTPADLDGNKVRIILNKEIVDPEDAKNAIYLISRSEQTLYSPASTPNHLKKDYELAVQLIETYF